jgi:hypothetical protein
VSGASASKRSDEGRRRIKAHCGTNKGEP